MEALSSPFNFVKVNKVLGHQCLRAELPCSLEIQQHISNYREQISGILAGVDDRLLVVVGPCSIHEPNAVLDYARRLKEVSTKYKDSLCIVMRAYFEKPRTNIGWKGFLYDPELNGNADMALGLRYARKLMLEINKIGLATATEFLCPINASYLADTVTWGAIGARTTESQIHRELVSSLPCPIGFKNSTDGNIDVAINAIKAANNAQVYCSYVNNEMCVVESQGNNDCHIVLRGGKQPNFTSPFVEQAIQKLQQNKVCSKLMIDCSHGNSLKKYQNQIMVVQDISEQIIKGNHSIAAVMIESFINEGSQSFVKEKALNYGQSITDECIGWDETLKVINILAKAVVQRRTYKTIASSSVSNNKNYSYG